MQRLFRSGLSALALLLVPKIAFAQIITPGIQGCNFVTGELTADCVPYFILHVIRIVFAFGGAASVIMIMVGGYMYVVAEMTGISKDDAFNTIRWAILGVLLSVFSFMIISFILSALGAW